MSQADTRKQQTRKANAMYINTYIYVYIYTYVYIHIHINVYIDDVYMFTYLWFSHISVFFSRVLCLKQTRANKRLENQMLCIHICIYIHIFIFIQTCIRMMHISSHMWVFLTCAMSQADTRKQRAKKANAVYIYIYMYIYT